MPLMSWRRSSRAGAGGTSGSPAAGSRGRWRCRSGSSPSTLVYRPASAASGRSGSRSTAEQHEVEVRLRRDVGAVVVDVGHVGAVEAVRRLLVDAGDLAGAAGVVGVAHELVRLRRVACAVGRGARAELGRVVAAHREERRLATVEGHRPGRWAASCAAAPAAACRAWRSGCRPGRSAGSGPRGSPCAPARSAPGARRRGSRARRSCAAPSSPTPRCPRTGWSRTGPPGAHTSPRAGSPSGWCRGRR